MKDPDRIYRRYLDLQSYVGWTDEDAAAGPRPSPGSRAASPRPGGRLLRRDRTPSAGPRGLHRRPGAGRPAQAALLAWLRELLTGPYDRDYVARRWQVGARHVEIGLDQVYTNAAMSRLRDGLVRHLGESWAGDRDGLVAAIRSLNKLLDLDLAKIEDAYQAEYVARIQASERLASLGQIAGGIAHEIRNPLNVIKSSHYYLKAAALDHAREAGRAHAADRAERDAGRAGHHHADELRPHAGARTAAVRARSRAFARRWKTPTSLPASRSRSIAPPTCRRRWPTSARSGSSWAT